MEFIPCGFDKTSQLLSFTHYDFAKNETLIQILTKMLGTSVSNADYQSKRLRGGSVGEVRLVTGVATTAGGEKLPYNVVLKIQKKWERQGDPGSWRREYDLYTSDFGTLFTDSFRWPECYFAEMNEEESEWQIWMEHIDGVSGHDLTIDMFERTAFELGQWQGKLYSKQPAALRNVNNLSDVNLMKNAYLHFKSWYEAYGYIRSDNCEIPKHLCEMLIGVDDIADGLWERIEKLPVVLCHRDPFAMNLFFSNNRIIYTDWDSAGWGYMGEDILNLIADDPNVENMAKYYRKCVPMYCKGFSEYADIFGITDIYICERIIAHFGYRLVKCYLDAKSPEEKALQIDILQKIYEMRDIDD